MPGQCQDGVPGAPPAASRDENRTAGRGNQAHKFFHGSGIRPEPGSLLNPNIANQIRRRCVLHVKGQVEDNGATFIDGGPEGPHRVCDCGVG